MKAPEKIYLQVCGDCNDDDCKNCNFQDLENNITWCRDKIFKNDVEYTRTDAFVDKAATWFANRYQANGSYLNADDIEEFIKTMKGEFHNLEVKESDETAEAFARIIRANLTGIDKDVQYKFEQLYKEITGEKMYQGYKD